MIFGVPLGNYTVHVDVDISDIGIISQRPYDLISQGILHQCSVVQLNLKVVKKIDTKLQGK
jgi:hypothetical protein